MTKSHKSSQNDSFDELDFRVRIQKYIADCGVTSRRKAEQFIREGRVELNGVVVTELGTKVDPQNDVIKVDGHLADLNSVNKVYAVFHKPRGVMTTVSDPEGRETVMDFIKEVSERIYPVGRLDYLSEGLLIMTNDGEVANMIMHPRYNITKVYEVKVFGSVTAAIITKLSQGVYLEDGFVKPTSVRVIKQLPTKTWLEFRLNEGKNREIRRLCEAVGLTVDKLKRMAIGGLSVEGIAPGKYRFLSKGQLLHMVGITEEGKKTASKAAKFQSSKKSVDLKVKGVQAGTQADDEAFHKFRRETYFDSLKQIQESKNKMAEKIALLENQIRLEEDQMRMERRFRQAPKN